MTISSWNKKYNKNGQFEGHWLSKSKSNNMNVTWKVIGVLKIFPKIGDHLKEIFE